MGGVGGRGGEGGGGKGRRGGGGVYRQPTRMSVYGEPSEDLKVAITGFNPRYLGPLVGHARS